jgi:hypothetical protein
LNARDTNALTIIKDRKELGEVIQTMIKYARYPHRSMAEAIASGVVELDVEAVLQFIERNKAATTL